MALEYIPFYFSYRRKLEKLSDQELGRLVRALLKFGEDGEAEQLAGRESIAFDFIADDIERARVAYDERCAKNKRNIEKRYAVEPEQGTTVYDGIRPNTNEYERYQTKDKAKDKDKTKGEYKETAAAAASKKAAAAPTVAEVKALCDKFGYAVDAEEFVAVYSENGWMAKGEPIQDWRALVRGWARTKAKDAEEGDIFD